ncbi:MAG: aminoacyl-tRNA hydrolase [Candidatus Gracilibacteria bacterium]|jgi:PTH1 family peptidyl-tRNA hydrolase|nr:aminoacyl-tRNA hydrolase [Candidatus Gracilibacteria bacterium]
MKAIFFLGNKGDKYHFTRHNAGFLLADFLCDEWNLGSFRDEKKLNSKIAEGFLNTEKLVFIKPQTYMNLSGDSVIKVMNFYKIKKDDILIVQDDKDMQFSNLRFREKGSHGGHNGIRDIIAKLKTQEFARLKIGVESRNEESRIETADFVLSSFTKEELNTLKKEIFPACKEKISDWLMN